MNAKETLKYHDSWDYLQQQHQKKTKKTKQQSLTQIWIPKQFFQR